MSTDNQPTQRDKRNMPGQLPEEAVGQGNKQNDATGESAPSQVGKGKGSQPQQGGRPRPDPNREPGDDTLYNEDKQGNVFYDKNTEIRRESQFHDATAAPLGDDKQKVKPENDQFGKKRS